MVLLGAETWAVGEKKAISYVHLVLMRSVTATVTTYPPGRHGTPKRTRFDPLNVLECTPQTLKEPLHGTSKVRPLRGDDGAILASPM